MEFDGYTIEVFPGPKDLSDVFGEAGSLATFVNQVRNVSPRTRVLIFQDFFQPFAA